MHSLRNSKKLYWGLIITFFILYVLVGFVSTLHSITFFELANTLWMAVLLGITYEVGQAAVLFSILMSKNNTKMLPWALMILLTALQVTANVYASFKFMDASQSMDWTYWQRSILFWLEVEGDEMFKIVISWITGALLPVVALGMTALVAENLKLREEQENEDLKEKLKEEIKEEQEEQEEKEKTKSEETPTVNLKPKTRTIEPALLKKNEETGKFEEHPIKEEKEEIKEDNSTTPELLEKESFELIDDKEKTKEDAEKQKEQRYHEDLEKIKRYQNDLDKIKNEYIKLSDENEKLKKGEYDKLDTSFNVSNTQIVKDLNDLVINEETSNKKLIGGEWVDIDPEELLDISSNIIKSNEKTAFIDHEDINKNSDSKFTNDSSNKIINEIIKDAPKENDISDVNLEPKKSEVVKPKKKKVTASEKVLKDHKKPKTKKRGWHLQKEYIDSNGDIYSFGKFTGKTKDVEDNKSDPGKKA